MCGVDQPKRPPTNVLSFIRGVRDQSIPGRIREAFCQIFILKHVPGVQLFKDDHADTACQLPAQLMGKVFAPVGDPLMDMLNGLASFVSFGGSL
jgi:hypothetical protein